jgi:hypothetical protein
MMEAGDNEGLPCQAKAPSMDFSSVGLISREIEL